MSILPKPQDQSAGPPPAVAHLRDLIRDSRFGRWVRRRKTWAAALVGLLALWKVGRWFLGDLLFHPAASGRFVFHHWLAILLVGAALWTLFFVAARLGIEFFTGEDDEPPSTLETGPSRHERPTVTHIPRAGG